MGRVYLTTLGDCEKHGVVLEIACPACGRVIYAAPDRLIGMTAGAARFIRATELAAIEPYLRCRGGSAQVGCGKKGARMRPLWPHEVPGLPKGVPVMAWLNGDDRERKRLVRMARD